MYYQKRFIIGFQVLIHLLGLNLAAEILSHFCVGKYGNYTQNSTYQANLNTIFSSNFSNVNQYGYYSSHVGENSDRVNAYVMCRGDIQKDTCRACINTSTRNIVEICPNQKEAVIWYDYCMLRYSNNPIAGVLNTDLVFFVWSMQNVTNVTKFNEVLYPFMASQRDQVAFGTLKKFATGNKTVPGGETIYLLQQCTPDLPADDCKICLTRGAADIAGNFNGRIGGRVIGPSCNYRYEISPFFTESPSESGHPPSHDVPIPSREATSLKHFCIDKSGIYTQKSKYKANLNAILSSLSSNIREYGYYSGSTGRKSDRVNAIVMCRGDIQLDTCRACINFATRDIVEKCPNQKEAVIWYEHCMLRYSNNAIAGILNTDLVFFMWSTQNVTNVTKFNEALYPFMASQREEVASGTIKKFATGKRSIPGAETIYLLQQCTPDLLADDCKICLTRGAADIAGNFNGRIGGRVIGPSCNYRYEISPFFGETPSEFGHSPSQEGL